MTLFAYNGFGIQTATVAVTTTLVTDCVLYGKSKGADQLWTGSVDTNFTCLQCLFGKGLKLTCGADCTAANFTPTCADITDCSAKKNYTGFPAYLNVLLSCYECQTTGNVVYIYQADVFLTDPAPFYKFITANNTAKNQIACAAQPATPVTNCLIYVDVNNGTNKLCIACKPGYAPFSYNT